jgi:transcriptional regulator with XRE-family HTH domain
VIIINGEFGKFIESNRLVHMIGLREMATKLNISPTYLCDIEKGRRNPPSYQILLQIKEILHLSKSEFEYMCDLAAEELTECPSDILCKIFKLDKEIRLSFWQSIRKSIEEVKEN